MPGPGRPARSSFTSRFEPALAALHNRSEFAEEDIRFMREALEEGRKAEGRTGDNPSVGCVLVQAGVIVGRGATQPPGGAHAEVMAIRAAEDVGRAISGCDFYVTLEPCTFQGRTPPCSRLLVEKNPRRVIVGMRDPHRRVRGAGIAELRQAGIEVVEGVLAEEIAAMLAAWTARNS